MKIETETFKDFTVHSSCDCKSFIHIKINDKEFYNKLFEYFFDEARLLRYAENKSSVSFSPTKANYATLYRKLAIFIDKENDIKFPEIEDEDILSILNEEFKVVEESGLKKIRLDKIGKIGEYIFSNLLSEYFQFECIIPKLNMTTDRNMNVFGIDTLFYSPKNKLILLGESKVSKSLDNGIALINKSLSEYEAQAHDEFDLILTQRWLKDKMGSFADEFGDKAEVSLNFLDFISKTGIREIGIPLFIAHGGLESLGDIFTKLSKINHVKLFGLETKYFIISLPMIDKEKFVKSFTQSIKTRRIVYEAVVRN